MENIKFRLRQANIMVAVIAAVLVVLAAIIVSLIFQFDLVENLVMSWILTTFYAIFVFFAVDGNIVKETIREIPAQPAIKVVEKPIFIDRPVIKEVPIQIPIENKTIEIIDRPVERIVERRIYVKRRKSKLNIPKFKYLASKETKTFHKTGCRLSKLIKKKYKVHSNSQASFKRKHFKACKSCLKKH